MLAIQISNGVRDQDLRKKLWDDDLELDDIIRKCHVHEQRKESKTLYSDSHSASTSSTNVNYQRRGRGRGNFRQPQGSRYSRGFQGQRGRSTHSQTRQMDRSTSTSTRNYQRRDTHRSEQASSTTPCENCATIHQANQCPARGKECNYCHKIGHFAIACRKRKRSESYAQNRNQSENRHRRNLNFYEQSDDTQDHYSHELSDFAETFDAHVFCTDVYDSVDMSMSHVACDDVNVSDVCIDNVEVSDVCDETYDDVIDVSVNHDVHEDLYDVSDVGCYNDVNVLCNYVYTVEQCSSRCNKWCETFKLNNGDNIHFKIDTQGEVSVMSRSVYNLLKSKPVLQPSSVLIHGFGGQVTKSRGFVMLPILRKDKMVYNVRVEIVDCKCPSILSDKDSEA